jgi:hypothetical protein
MSERTFSGWNWRRYRATSKPKGATWRISVESDLRDARNRAETAERDRDAAIATAEQLQKEKDEHWKTQIKETKKIHPGQAKLLKMFMAATREEWEEVMAFLDRFDGHLPVGMVRVAQGTKTLLEGADPAATTNK